MACPVGPRLHDARQRFAGLGGCWHRRAQQQDAKAAPWLHAPDEFAEVFVKGQDYSACLDGACEKLVAGRYVTLVGECIE